MIGIYKATCPRRCVSPLFFVLTALARGPRRGYAVMQDVEDLSEGRIRLRTGTLYAAFDRLSDHKLIESAGEEVVDGRLRRYYRLTELGMPHWALNRGVGSLSPMRPFVGSDWPEAGMTDLERRYCRWLRAYPVEYRQVRGEEILSTLLDAAPANRRQNERFTSHRHAWAARSMEFAGASLRPRGTAPLRSQRHTHFGLLGRREFGSTLPSPTTARKSAALTSTTSWWDSFRRARYDDPACRVHSSMRRSSLF